jgi:hypothetical protein
MRLLQRRSGFFLKSPVLLVNDCSPDLKLPTLHGECYDQFPEMLRSSCGPPLYATYKNEGVRGSNLRLALVYGKAPIRLCEKGGP